MMTTDNNVIPLGEFKISTGSTLASHSDKSILPASILSSILEFPQFKNDSLPHPLIFELSKGGKKTIIGVKEFTSPDYSVIVPQSIYDKLENNDELVSIKLINNLPNATFLKLKPLQFYPQINNWKYYLESHLPLLYTTLAKGETLTIESDNNQYELLIEDSNESIVNIIDTDVILDIVPLNDIMASQQIEYDKNLNYLENINEIAVGVHKLTNLKSMDKSMVPIIYKIDLTKINKRYLKFDIFNENSNELGKGDYSSIFNTDLIIGYDKLINLENFRFETMSSDFDIQEQVKKDSKWVKTIMIDIQNDDIQNNLLKKFNNDDENAGFLYILPFNWEFSNDVTLTINELSEVPTPALQTDGPNVDQIICSNCKSLISKTKQPTHEAFCYRHNKRCECNEVFLDKIPSNHWHCEYCDIEKFHGSSSLLKFKHDKLYHSSYTCCNQEFANYFELVNHKSTTCPFKLHECQFCHLILPQEQADFQDNFANLSHHENNCGNKTTECFQCNKILKRKDLTKHLKIHQLDKIENTKNVSTFSQKCTNENCIHLIESMTNDLGLCDYCYGSIYSNQLDPNNIKLQNRLERKYILQLSKGCGFIWCENIECSTGSKNLGQFQERPFKQLITHVHKNLLSRISRPLLPLNKSHAPDPNGNKFWFCVNESITNKKKMVAKLLLEHVYEEIVLYKAVNEVPTSDESLVRLWLVENIA